MANVWKWIPKSEKPKSAIEKVDVLKEDETVIKKDDGKELFPNDSKARNSPKPIVRLKNGDSRVIELSIQSKLLIANDDRDSFESILGEKYVDTGTYF